MVNFTLYFLFLLLLLPIPTSAANHHRRRHPHPPPPSPPPPPPPPPPTHPPPPPTHPPPPPPQTHPPPPPRTHPPPPPLHQHQVNNIIDALIGAGDFNNWASMLSTTHFFMLPLSATLFVPSDDSLFPFPLPIPTSTTAATSAASSSSFDPLNIPYHIVPQRLTFSQLTLFKPFSRLPTLLPSRSLLITNTSTSNFTLDSSHISHPDLYLTSELAVHGIASLLNYSVFGGESSISPPLPPPPPPPPAVSRPLGDAMGDHRRRSDAGCLYGEFAFVSLMIPWVAWIIKIYGNPLGL